MNNELGSADIKSDWLRNGSNQNQIILFNTITFLLHKYVNNRKITYNIQYRKNNILVE